tara:strand:+ start:51 stop:344 length:294 start_codon:yes stop_codon:yes gene_type:complete
MPSIVMWNRKAKVKELAREVAKLKRDVRHLKCGHSNWEFASDNPDPHWARSFWKQCPSCGKQVGMTKQTWLEAKAEDAYRKHTEAVDQINELNKEGE